MIGNQRYGTKITTSRLSIHNPFRSTGVTKPLSKTFSVPLFGVGDQKQMIMKMMAQLANKKMLGDDPMEIPDDLGVDLGKYMPSEVVLPSGVTSVSNAEKERDLKRKIERYNAGILDDDMREKKALYKLAKKTKKDEYRGKIIQWLAETDELDSVPKEYEEEVNEYYTKKYGANAVRAKQEKEEKRRQKREKREKKEAEERARAMYWYKSPFERLAAPNYTVASGSGWRAPRLHKLVRPLKRFEIEETPDKIIENEKQDLDERRQTYRDEQTNQRGVEPPKSMVERAMPKLAKPFAPVYNEKFKFMGIVPHPFVAKKMKYNFDPFDARR